MPQSWLTRIAPATMKPGIDRSSPPTIITIVWPRAASPSSAASTSIERTLVLLEKPLIEAAP